MAPDRGRRFRQTGAKVRIGAAARRGPVREPGYFRVIQMVLVCRYWSIASVPLSRLSEPERL